MRPIMIIMLKKQKEAKENSHRPVRQLLLFNKIITLLKALQSVEFKFSFEKGVRDYHAT